MEDFGDLGRLQIGDVSEFITAAEVGFPLLFKSVQYFNGNICQEVKEVCCGIKTTGKNHFVN